VTTKPALQEILKGTLSGKERPKVAKTRKEQSKKTSNKMALNSYLSIITLNVNGLNAPVKRHMSKWIKKIRPIYMFASKRLILDLKTPAD